MASKTPDGLLHALLLDRNGGASPLAPADIEKWRPEDGLLWLHLDVNEKLPVKWMRASLGLDRVVVEALNADETRPRSLNIGDGLLTVLRGVNMNPGEDPEDMVSIRLWIERDRIVSTRRRKLLSVQDLREQLEQGQGPKTSGEFLAALIGRLADRIGGFFDTIEENLSSIEEAESNDAVQTRRHSLAALRRQIASVRRFVAPQRDALETPKPTACARKPTASCATSRISISPGSGPSCCRKNCSTNSPSSRTRACTCCPSSPPFSCRSPSSPGCSA